MSSEQEIINFLDNTHTCNNTNIMFEQYKLFVGLSDKLSSRRVATNAFFLTLNSAIFAFQSLTTIYLAAAGFVLGFVWCCQLKSYAKLNEAKFKIIHKIEEKLPYKLFYIEWELLKRGETPDIYRRLTSIERFVPIIFIVLHCITFVQNIDWRIC